MQAVDDPKEGLDVLLAVAAAVMHERDGAVERLLEDRLGDHTRSRELPVERVDVPQHVAAYQVAGACPFGGGERTVGGADHLRAHARGVLQCVEGG